MKSLRPICFTFITFIISTVLVDVAHSQTLFGLAHVGPNGPSTLYTINPATGAATLVGPVGFERCSGMDFNSSGTLFATCERSNGSDIHVLIIINTSSGAGTEVGPTGVESLPGPFPGFDTASDISFRSDGTLFAYTFPGDGLVTINLATGAMTQLGFPSGIPTGAGYGLSFSPGDTLFSAVSDILSTLNQVTSVATFVTNLFYTSPVTRTNAMDFQPGTGILFASVRGGFFGGSSFLATINTTTGVVTNIGQSVDGLDAIAFQPLTPTSTTIPTLSQWGMIIMSGLLGLIALYAICRKNRDSPDFF